MPVSKVDSELFKNTVKNSIPPDKDVKNPVSINSSSKTVRKKYHPKESRHIVYCKTGVDQDKAWREVGKIKFNQQNSLDLHGSSYEQARQQLETFMSRMQHQWLLIIHGKGQNSQYGKAVLKPMVHDWLQNYSKTLFIANAKDQDGGSGAVYVKIKRK